MALTLSESSLPSESTGLSVLAPPNSNETSMQHVPNVLIVPPEEEHENNPPWTYFDAHTDARADLSTSPDIDALDVALGIFQQTDNRAPTFHRALSNESSDTVIMPKKNGDSGASIDYSRHCRGVGDDIIEVVKVRRNEGMVDVTDMKGAGLKKSKTFRARASQALKTIRGVANKGSRKSSFSSSNSGEQWPTQEVAENPDVDMEAGVLPRPTTPGMSRRKSMQLVQLFSSTRKRTTSTATTATTATAVSTSTPDVPASPASSDFSIISTPSTPTEESLPTPVSSLSDRTNQDANAPGATINKRRSFVSKISVLDVQRLFAPAPSPSRPIVTHESAPTFSRTTRRDSLPVPPSLPQLPHIQPEEDVFAANSPLQRPHSFHAPTARYSLSSLSEVKVPTNSSNILASRSPSSPEDIPEETSFEAELRLDSLHFDSLHFDPDEFALTL
ncbi:hypothetical protein EIP91_009477 [Steccherinum ochraceum]|uniref:Uncharacterized protein n=1 Tax=Steccherinum ochraceum TaxID=92696 RepID=A0A4R0RMR2_9APHY|nr:hypothetical protein EIP91_009477 [Steccherinum ochraceum]